MNYDIIIVDPSLGADGIVRALNHSLAVIQRKRNADFQIDDTTVHVVACVFVPALGLVYTVELR